MKYVLLTSIILTFAGSAIAQEQAPKPIRETLFGSSYKEDMQKAHTNVNARKAANPRSTATSSKTLLFTDYHPQRKSSFSSRKVAAAKTPVPSAVSAKEAAAKAPKPVLLKAPVMQQEPSAPQTKTAVAPTVKKN